MIPVMTLISLGLGLSRTDNLTKGATVAVEIKKVNTDVKVSPMDE
jgi:hypothetical protein